MANGTIKKPLRLILGQSTGYQSIAPQMIFVCEEPGGRASSFELRNYEAVSKMRFIDEGESEVVWERVEKAGIFGGAKTEIAVKEIRIHRDFQIGKR